MQVQPPLQNLLYHAHAHSSPPEQKHTHSNGAHSDSQHSSHASHNGHLNGGDMNPYQHQYAGGYGQPQQQQQRQNPPNQLPPMYPSMSMSSMGPPPGPGMAGPSNVPQPAMYPNQAMTQLPQSSQSTLPKEKQMQGSNNNGTYQFELRVDQQPQRARMCGFGDKDRRPITPPPCVQLIVTDMATGERVTPEQIESTFFVLQVDLWDDNATREVNIVRSSGTSPAVSISTATTTSYPPTPDRPLGPQNAAGYLQTMVYTAPDGQQMYAPAPPQAYGNPMARPSFGGGYPNVGYYQQQFANPADAMMYAHGPAMPGPGMPPITHSNTSMFTRNLIGSLTVNASALKDPEGNPGFWFVLQDLSVRTEGWFR